MFNISIPLKVNDLWFYFSYIYVKISDIYERTDVQNDDKYKRQW
jgi:hypothetical protein